MELHMPRFYIDTYDKYAVVDEDGHDLPNEAAVQTLVQRSLAEMAAEEVTARSPAHIRAYVRDEAGRRIMTATVSVSIQWTNEVEAGDRAVG
jgi:hypothetical protein